MAFQEKPNQCGLFVNVRAPEKSDYSAQISITCPKCGATSPWWLSGWKKTARSGLKYISLSLRPKGAPHPGRTEPAASADEDVAW